MLSLFLLGIGLLIILISIIFIFNLNQRDEDNVSEEVLKKDDELVITIESLENIICDINDTFNNTIDEIEKKYEKLETKIYHVDKKASENYEHVTLANKYNNNYDNNTNDYIDNKVDGRETMDKKTFLSDNKSLEIIELKNKGLSVQQIAKELNIGTGEVILILNLKKAKG